MVDYFLNFLESFPINVKQHFLLLQMYTLVTFFQDPYGRRLVVSRMYDIYKTIILFPITVF